jgi:hypothetical protein
MGRLVDEAACCNPPGRLRLRLIVDADPYLNATMVRMGLCAIVENEPGAQLSNRENVRL